jgi:hypothetical protein
MSVWSNLFGGGASAAAPAAAKTLDYNGYLISAEPFKEGGQWQLAGRITKEGKEHRFIRADKFSDKDDCAEIAIAKGQLIVDQLGERMFK